MIDIVKKDITDSVWQKISGLYGTHVTDIVFTATVVHGNSLVTTIFSMWDQCNDNVYKKCIPMAHMYDVVFDRLVEDVDCSIRRSITRQLAITLKNDIHHDAFIDLHIPNHVATAIELD